MKKNAHKLKIILSISMILIMLMGMILPTAFATDANKSSKGFEKGIPYKPFIPLKRTTFVEFDKESYIDDYSYLASIPSSVFSVDDVLYANPLLFHQAEGTYPDTDEYRFLNDYKGIDYLMQDWMGYSNYELDRLNLINVGRNDIDQSWKAKKVTEIMSKDVFEIAKEIALKDWSYSDNAVVSVIKEDFEKPENTEFTGTIKGEIHGEVGRDSLVVKRPYGPAPQYARFSVEDEYKYVRTDLWYPSIVYVSSILKLVPGFAKGWITFPQLDPDLQLYCKYDEDWLQVDASSEMTINNGPHEKCFSYVYNPGTWRVGVTNMPTEQTPEDLFIHEGPLGKVHYYGKTIEAVKSFLGKEIKEYNVEITKYPGTEICIPDKPGIGYGNAKFTLKWDNTEEDLGLTIIGPNGEELESAIDGEDEKEGIQEISFDQLGQCMEDTCYKVVVYALDDIKTPINFEVEYSWEQKIKQEEVDLLASACEGAILASTQNAPLLYVSPDEMPQETKEAINTLGIKNIDLVDLNEYISDEVIEDLEKSVEISNHYTKYMDIYNAIKDETKVSDVVFSTIDPWSYWMYNESAKGLRPEGEFEKAFYFGPAAYASALHGSPLFLVESHAELSSAVMWHAEFWKKHGNGYAHPPTAPIFLTGNKVYEFLRENGFDEKGAESILTVAGQYEIGPSWTRMFTGVGNPGNLIGTPIDTANSISRSVFYPALIFQNPALQGPVNLENGSMSKRVQPSLLQPFKSLRQRLFNRPFGSNLKITRESQIEKYDYPVLFTYGTYSHRFNELGSQYWDAKYQTRTGMIPGVTYTGKEIDQGTREINEGIAGAFYPDMSESEITPFYARKAGYNGAFSTNYDVTINNLNQGVISWYMIMHGNSGNGGELSWYSPASIQEALANFIPKPLAKIIQLVIGLPLGIYPLSETNPWRGYEILWGSTENPDSATLNTEVGLILGLLGLGNPQGPFNGGILKTGLDFIPSNIALFKGNRGDYKDGLVGPFGLTGLILKYHFRNTAAELDDQLENLHSMSFHATSCLIGGKYIQIAFARHGSVSQELDPWSTSYWGAPAHQATPREFALGATVGEAYSKGRTEIGPQYIFEEGEKRVWWWDNAENNVLYADPDLRIWIPSTYWDEKEQNHWDQSDIMPQRYDGDFSADGHMPFGVSEYPHQKEPSTEIPMIWIVIIIIIIILLAAVLLRPKKKKK